MLIIGNFGFINIKTKDNRLVHTYNKASINSMAQAKNNNLIFNGKLYFNDTVSKKNDELDAIDMDLYIVDLKSGKSQLYKKSAQNPIVYKGKIYVIVRGEDGNFNTITSLDGKESFKLQYGIRELCPTDKGILQCVTVEPEKEEQVSNSRLYLDTLNKDIAFTNVYMGNFVNNRKYVMWCVADNSAGGCYAYSVDRDKFINIYPIEESKNTTYSVGMALDGTFFVYTVEYDNRGEIASSNNFTVSFEE